jgi:hypothetical protein
MTYNPDELSMYDDDYEQAPEDTGPTLGPVPPGTYQVTVDKAEIKDNEYDGHPKLILQCRIISDKETGRMLFLDGSFNNNAVIPLNGKKVAPIVFLKSMIARLDLNPPPKKASEIAMRLDEVLDRVLELRVKKNPRNPDYPKVYLNRFVCMFEPGMDAGSDGIDEQLDGAGF